MKYQIRNTLCLNCLRMSPVFDSISSVRICVRLDVREVCKTNLKTWALNFFSCYNLLGLHRRWHRKLDNRSIDRLRNRKKTAWEKLFPPFQNVTETTTQSRPEYTNPKEVKCYFCVESYQHLWSYQYVGCLSQQTPICSDGTSFKREVEF